MSDPFDGLPDLESHADIIAAIPVESVYSIPVEAPLSPPPAAVAHGHTITVDVDHFQVRPTCKRKDHSRRAPAFNESDIYNHNPAPSSLLVIKKQALKLTDADGRTYWNAIDENNNCNMEWVSQYMNSSGCDPTDCVLLVKNKRCDSVNYTSFPDHGLITFMTGTPPTYMPAAPQVYNVTSTVVHTSNYQCGTRSRKTCYIVVRNGFTYNHDVK